MATDSGSNVIFRQAASLVVKRRFGFGSAGFLTVLVTMTASPDSGVDGSAGQPWELIVERGKIAEFADAMLCDDPAYRGPDAIIPATFLTTGGRWAPAEFGLTWVRSQTVAARRAGIHLPRRSARRRRHPDRARARHRPLLEAGKARGTMRFATVVTEYRDAGGVLAAEARATFIETAAKK